MPAFPSQWSENDALRLPGRALLLLMWMLSRKLLAARVQVSQKYVFLVSTWTVEVCEWVKERANSDLINRATVLGSPYVTCLRLHSPSAAQLGLEALCLGIPSELLEFETIYTSFRQWWLTSIHLLFKGMINRVDTSDLGKICPKVVCESRSVKILLKL